MTYRGYDLDALPAPRIWIAYCDRREVGVSGSELGAFRVARRYVDMRLAKAAQTAERPSAEIIPIGLAKMMQGIGLGDWEG